MSKITSLITTILFLIAGFSGWLILHNNYHFEIEPNEIHKVDMFMVNVIYTKMDENGRPKNQFFSPKVIHYPYHNSSKFVSPHFIIASKPTEKPWDITAKHGLSEGGLKTVQLWDDVKVHQTAGANNQENTMTTTQLTIYPKRHYAETNQAVTITQPGSVIKGIGLKATLDKGIVELLSHPHGIYNIPAS